MACSCTPRAEVAEAALADAKVLPAQLDECSRRELKLCDVVKKLKQEPREDWDLEGPRTVLYCVTEIARKGSGPVSRFQRWKQANKVSDEDHGVEFCEVAAEVMELALCRDQLDVTNILAFERLESKRQFIEEIYRQRSEESRKMKYAGRDAASLTQEAFSSKTRMACEAIIAPELLSHVARKATESSEMLKQYQKALEARGLAVPQHKGK